jgi:hypothetical protein
MYSKISPFEKYSERSKSPDGEDPESELFLLEETPINTRRAFLRKNWRLLLESLLLLLLGISLSMFYGHQKPLLQRQRQCGRLLGQWCRQNRFLIHIKTDRFFDSTKC